MAVVLGCLAWVSLDGQARGKVARTGEWEPPLTPHGVPDLEGVWVNNSATPLERPPELERKPALTDKEVADLQARADRLFENGNSDFPQTDDVFLAALRNVDRYENPSRTASSYFHARRIKYEFTVADNTTWTRPWTVEIRLRRSDEEIYEFGCHEGNYSMRGILAATRAEENRVPVPVRGDWMLDTL